MCGGIAYKYKNIDEAELKKFYGEEKIKEFKEKDRVESFYWQKNAVLPIREKDGVRLRLWGNKDKDLKLPQTGWARLESLKEGKWDYLKPELVKIPADGGYEKKTWFGFKNGTDGLLVRKDGEERVYMLTKEASEEYRDKTGHEREPVGEGKIFNV